MQLSDEIKARLDIVDLIRDYIPIKAAGVNFRANCPFHREKTPSFMVSPEKQIWHCFGCQKGGDIFSFIQEIEGVSFVEALRILAPKAGVTLKKQNPQIASQKNRLLDIMDAAVNYYHDILLDSPDAQAAREYLAKRGLSEETIKAWQIGYSPDSWDDILNWLKGQGYKENEIFSAGMSIKKESTSRFYNRFRDRIMFPIWDVNASVVAFSARVNPAKEVEEKMGKYINSPQTLIYDKSKILFGLDKAKMEIKAQDIAIVVEGQMDVISAHQAGFKNVIASSGTALTREQVILIKRYSNNIALAFDMDKAGQMAAERGIREAMQAEMNIKVIELGFGKDPDECIRENPGEWQRAAKEARPMMEYYFDQAFSGLNSDVVEDKREAAKRLLPMIHRLANKIEQDHWLKKLGEKINISEQALRETLVSIKKPIKPSIKNEENYTPAQAESRPRAKEEVLSNMVLALVIKFPNLFNYIVDHINVDQIIGFDQQTLYRNLVIYYNNLIEESSEAGAVINFNNFRAWLKQKEENLEAEPVQTVKLLDRLALLGDRDFYELDNSSARNELINVVLRLKKNYLSGRMREIEKLIAQSEQDGDTIRLNELMQELKSLSDERRELKI